LDEERIRKRLALIEEVSGLIAKSLPKTEGAYRGADRLTKDATERRLQIVSEAELDVIRVLYRDFGERIVGDEESLIDSMEKSLGRGTVGQVKKRRALRNRLVHAYMDADPAEIYRQASELSDLKHFERAVLSALRATN
jgi:uncharacterized protein YutE (UPF0331/DUF86 family)